jgi:2-polyprenyl-3-methyl-5-hydroxy-6-metoxy-1,4-benzoquinol methylase
MASGCFDLLAANYDRDWTNSSSGRLQREAVWRHIGKLFRAGDSILDLGCGTGEDAVRLAHRGVRVRALDASPEMVKIARSRGVCAEIGNIEDLQQFEGKFQGVISNFGALNCIADLESIRRPLARLVLPSGFLAICLMNRFCLIESLYYLSRLRFQKATRRWRGRAFVASLALDVFYPLPHRVMNALRPEFRLIRRVGIGLDEYISHWPFLRSLADHQLFIFVRE